MQMPQGRVDEMTWKIRPLADRDRSDWETLWRGYLTFYEATVSEEVTETTWRRLMTKGEDPEGFCATGDDDRPVGIVHYLFHRSTWTTGDYCYLQDLFVSPEVRTGGAGRALIEAVYAAAEARGASQTYWLTQDFNATARKLYDRIGQLTPFIKYRSPV